MLDPEYGFMAQYVRLRPLPVDAPTEIAAEIERIEQRLGELEEIGEEDWSDELATEAAQLEERRGELDETVDGLAVYSDRDRARAGVIVTIGDDGEFCLHQGLVERMAVRGAVDTDQADAQTDDDGDEPFTPVSDDEDGDPSPRPSSTGAEQKLRKECGFSQSLVDDLKAHRLQITRAHLAADFDAAFDLTLYSLCVDLFDQRYRSHPLDLRATESAPRSSLNDLSGTPADRLIETHGTALDLDWLKLPPAEGFAALAALPMEAKQRLFAVHCVLHEAAARDRGPRPSDHRMRRQPSCDPVRRLLAAYRRQLLGPGEEGARARDRERPSSAIAGHGTMPTTRNPCWRRRSKPPSIRRRASPASVSTGPRATKLPSGCPPGMAYAGDAGAAARPELDGASPINGDPRDADDAEPDGIDLAGTALPAFSPRTIRPAPRSTAPRLLNDECHYVGIPARATIRTPYGIDPQCSITSEVLSPDFGDRERQRRPVFRGSLSRGTRGSDRDARLPENTRNTA